jgi:2-iminobutanoate/2-iminopropanoate deaminase
MKIRTLAMASFLLFSTVSFAAEPERKHVVLHPSPARNAFPFSDAVLVGDTLYLAGTVGLDSNGKPPASAEQEAKLAMDGFKDLVSVQVFCNDFALYDTFNGVYGTYFHQQFPARAFVGVASLIRGAHFELMGVAVKRSK